MKKKIEKIIPDHMRNFIEVAHCDLPPKSEEFITALEEAFMVITQYEVRINKKYRLIIGTSPFRIPTNPGNPADPGLVIFQDITDHSV